MSDKLAREFLELKEDLAELERDAERNQGAVDQLKRQLRDDFGCESVKDARRLLEKEENKENDLKEEFQTALEVFRKEHDDLSRESV